MTIGGGPVFTGFIVSVVPSLNAGAREVSISAYSLPGVLMDCTPPASAFPLEFYNTDLKYIARQVVRPFGLIVKFTTPAGPKFEQVSCDVEKKVFEFLVDLAQQRNIIISDSEAGELVFESPIPPGKPVAILKQGDPTLVSVTPQFQGQNYYSHVTGIGAAVPGLPGQQFTVKNPRVKTLRPYVFKVSDTMSMDIKSAVQAKAGRMLANMAAYTIRVPTWRDPAGALWAPNTTVKVQAPGAMINNEYEFLIRSVTLERSATGMAAALNLVIPGAFRGSIPEAMPWD